jgi:Uma2 family endonuclease
MTGGAMSASPQRLLSPEEYLAFERSVPTKHAYFRGEMFAMGGASTEHNQLTFNLAGLLYSLLKDRPCQAYVNDMRVKVSASGLYTYPDVVITCDTPRFEDKEFDTLLNPQVIIEVLSDSTEKYDRGKKFEQYQQIDSLREYLLVSHGYPSIDQHLRGDDGVWTLRQVRGLDGTVELPTVACQLRLADVYAKVAFPPEDEANRAAGLLTRDESR